MSSLNEVLNFIKENKKYLPAIVNEKDIKTVIEAGKITAEQVLKRLKTDVNKAKSFKKVVDEINKFNIEKQDKIFNKQLDKITSEIVPEDEEVINEQDLKITHMTNKERIKNCDINETPLILYFNKQSNTNITQIKDELINKLDELKTIKGARCVIKFFVDGKPQYVTKHLDNEDGFKCVINILTNPKFELYTNIEQENTPDDNGLSDTNRDYINGISMDMISSLRFITKEQQFKKLGLNTVKIYCDNSGSFYNYKINECFKECEIVKNHLLKYQITNNLKNDIFNMNCLIYALKMSGKVEDKTIQELLLDNNMRKISQKALSLIGQH